MLDLGASANQEWKRAVTRCFGRSGNKVGCLREGDEAFRVGDFLGVNAAPGQYRDRVDTIATEHAGNFDENTNSLQTDRSLDEISTARLTPSKVQYTIVNDQKWRIAASTVKTGPRRLP